MQEVAASAERSAAGRGEAATLAWLWHGSAASMTVNTAG